MGQISTIPRPNFMGRQVKKYDFVITNAGSQAANQMQTGMAPSAKDLIALYARLGDQIHIIREYEDEECRMYGKSNMQELVEEQKKEFGKGNVPVPMLQVDGPICQPGAAPHQATETPQQFSAPQNQLPPPQPVSPTPPPPTAPQVTYFKAGPYEFKNENGKVYQKMWLPLTDEEMRNYRLISEKNGKVLPMEGKRIEMQKWVLPQTGE
jgi:hypothetical protein